MSIQIKCPECGRVGNAPDGAFDRALTCRGCGSKIMVADSLVKVPSDFAVRDSFAPPGIKRSAQSAVFPGSARSRVQGPAIALIVTAVIGIGFSLIMMVQSVFFLSAIPQITQDIDKVVENVEKRQQDKPGDARQMRQDTQDALGLFNSIASWWKSLSITMSLLSIVGGAIVLSGALSMMSLRRYPLAVTGSVLAMIPALGPCCVLGLPLGIWALVVLCRSDVRSAFSSQASST